MIVRLLLRTGFLWATARLALFLVGVIAFPPFAPAVVALVVAFVLWIQMRRAREFVLIENLGVRPLTLMGIAFGFALALEVALWVGLSLAGVWNGGS